MRKSIRVSAETHATLAALKGEDETFDELLTRFIRERGESLREGAGRWQDTDAADKARAKRREMKQGLGDG